MKPPQVFFSEKFEPTVIKILFEKACQCENGDIQKADRTAIKVHFGEKGNSRFVPPRSIKPVVDALKAMNSDFFLTDANTLYRGMRLNATDHLKIAMKHGFGALGTRIVIADGELGDEEENIEIRKEIFSHVKIGRQIAKADAIVAISHFKGHILFGFGGALKNIGMGSGSRAGKLEMHSKLKPSVSAACISCGQCVENCGVNAIRIGADQAIIEEDRCIGCAKCIALCKEGAIAIPWSGATRVEVQQRCAEYAYGALLGKKCVCLTFINNITRDCDCLADSEIIGKDIGIVCSTDPVACEQAAYDLVLARHGSDIFRKATGVNGLHIIDHAETIGLGKKEYTLIRI